MAEDQPNSKQPVSESPGLTSSDQAYGPGTDLRTTMPEGLDDGEFHLFAKTMAQTRMAVCLSDPQQHDTPIVFANRAFLDLTGYEEDEVVGRNCRFLQGEATDAKAVRKLRDAIADEKVVVVEILNYRKDGTAFWNALHLGPLYDEQGELAYYFGSQWDVSDIHLAREGETQAKLLARELSHRVKNMFSVVSSVVTLTGRHRNAVPLASEINDRIRALARAYEVTLDNASDQRVGLVPLLEAVLKPYGLAGDGDERIALDGDDVDMPGVTVSVLGLVLHELATNAVKYGALDPSGTGKVSLDWHREPDGATDRLVMHWTETGGSATAQRHEDGGPRGGTGSAIVASLLSSARGEIHYDWRPSGLVATLKLPIDL